MSRPNPAGSLPARDGDPLFAEAWEAEVIGLAFSLIEAGRFTNAAWSEALGAAIAARATAGLPDDAEGYYLAALDALEGLLAKSDLAAPEEVAARKADWVAAYEATPHGQPVSLANKVPLTQPSISLSKSTPSS
ncbi:MAG: nitrile hydratase accessory protein [Pseudomonadota bacterium]